MVLDLHVAKNVEELNKLAELSKDIKLKPTLQLSKSTLTVLRKAEDCYKAGDEENAFLFYMKYFNLIEIIRKKKDFDKIKIKQREYFGTKDEIMRRMDILGDLKKSLQKRYDTREQQEIKNKFTVENKENFSTNVTPNVSDSKFIDCLELHKRISEAKEKILLLDCRPKSDFESSKIKFNNCINIPENIIKNGITAVHLSKTFSGDTQKLFNAREKMDLIVLLDEDTSETPTSDTSKSIWVLREIFMNWDPHTIYKSVLLLDGGFRQFLITYPMKTTNPKYEPKPKAAPTQVVVSDIEYPSFSDIKMKPKPTETAFVPRIDRSSKPIPGQKTFESQQPINPVSLVQEREKMLDQVLKKEMEVIELNNELRNVVNARIDPSEQDKSDWFKKQTDLEYKMVQKEAELNDTLEGLPDNDLDSLNIGAQDPDLYKRFKEKQLAHLGNERKIKEVTTEIEEKRRATKEQEKRHFEMKEEEDEIIRPKQPAFDRSMKPNFENPERFPQIHRDFSPVHGSYGDIGATGLKNLGNTCYMNSIIQCLLNHDGLCGYLKNNLYTKHINRKSKTHGFITEELAQLCKELWSGKYKSVAPRDFRSAFGKEHKMFATYDQQDAHEFLVILIDLLHSELQFPMENVILSDRASQSDIAWRDFSKNMQSITQKLFFGQIRSTVKCLTCEFESATYEGFSHLSLELPHDSRRFELYDCLDSYFDGETIEGWTCPRCKQNRDAIKKVDISKLPPVLVIHLKRFYASMDSTNTYIKKQNFVHFPTIDFQISNYITRSLKQEHGSSTYKLYAVSNHYGTMNRGHYTAFCKNAKTQSWYKYDDNYVTQIASNDVVSSAGYILFYSQY